MVPLFGVAVYHQCYVGIFLDVSYPTQLMDFNTLGFAIERNDDGSAIPDKYYGYAVRDASSIARGKMGNACGIQEGDLFRG